MGVALALAVGFVAHAAAWAFVCDDAFISFRYAANLAEHGALVFNVGVTPPERVEGYSNFLWVVVLAGIDWLGPPPEQVAPVLTRLCALAGLVMATALLRQLRRPEGDPDRRVRTADLLPAAFLISTPLYVVWANSGLETALAAALAVAAMACWLGMRIVAAGALASLAGLTRTDALVPIASFGVAWLLIAGLPALVKTPSKALTRVPWRRLGWALLVFVAPLGVHLMWRKAYYGAWLPNTWAIKAHGVLLRGQNGVPYALGWAQDIHLAYLAPLLLWVRPRHGLLFVPIAAVIGYGWWVGGDFMAYSRFYVTATVLLAVGAAWLLADAGQMLGGWVTSRHRSVSAAFPVVVGAGLVLGLAVDARGLLAVDRAKTGGWLDGRWEGVTTMDRFAKVGGAVGLWMREHLPPDTWVSVGAAGAGPYASGLPTVDAFGLVDPNLVRMANLKPYAGKNARPGHQLFAPPRYIKRRDPDLLCHVGYRGPRRPPESRAVKPFRRGYTWACVELEPLADSQGKVFDPGVYCCRRPSGRVVGPFGEQERER